MSSMNNSVWITAESFIIEFAGIPCRFYHEYSALPNISGNRTARNIRFIFEFTFRIEVNFNLDIYVLLYIVTRN